MTIFLTGIPSLNQPPNVVPSEQLRLNVAIPPVPNPNALGVLGGDAAGFPNGRRLGDDVVDIAFRVMAGASPLTPTFNTGINAQLGDGVSANDVPFLTTFPFVADAARRQRQVTGIRLMTTHQTGGFHAIDDSRRGHDRGDQRRRHRHRRGTDRADEPGDVRRREMVRLALCRLAVRRRPAPQRVDRRRLRRVAARKWLGVEAELSDSPNSFEQNGFLISRRLTTFMGNAFVNLPNTGRLLPYAVGGAGLLHPRLTEAGGLASVETNHWAYNAGGGAVFVVARHLGIRGDLRYFHGLGQTDADTNALGLDLSKFGFWRGSGGLVVGF